MCNARSLLLPLCIVLVLALSAHGCSYLKDDVLIRNVPENVAIGSKITLIARTATIPPSTNTFSVQKSGTGPFPFELLQPASANITLNVTEELDREKTTSYSFKFICYINGVKNKDLTGIVVLDDIDDTSPQWVSPGHFSASINEGNEIGVLLPFNTPAPRITDADKTESQTFNFSLATGPYSSYFQVINAKTTRPEIKVVKQLDYEVQKIFNLTLIVKDKDLSGTVKFTITAPLTVNVKNVEDEPPKFQQTKYWTLVAATATKGQVLTLQPENLKAVDGDADHNAAINYALLSSTIVNIDATTGVLTLNRNNPDPRTYRVLVKAFEKDRPKREAIVQVEINVTASSLVPVCRSPVRDIKVPENSQTGFRLLSMDVNYQYQSQLTYKILTEAAMFNVTGGWLLLKGQLDFETTTKYDVKVEVSNGVTKATCQIRVAVEDVNDNIPKFVRSSYEFKAAKYDFGTTVGTVKAEDKDAGTVIAYSLQTKSTSFSIDASSGEVKIATKPRLTEKQYSFIVVAKDNGSPALEGQAMVTVVITQSQSEEVSSTNPLVIGLATVGTVLVVVLIIVVIVFILYRRRYI